jgi:hypothetical protein
MTRLDRTATFPLMMLSLAAGVIHFAVIPEHLEEFVPYAVLFAALAWYQVIWPFTYVWYRAAWVTWLTVTVNVGAVVVWAWSRTIGLPFGPEPGEVEAVGPLDVTASAMELVLATLLVVLMRPPAGRDLGRLRLSRRSAWLGGFLWAVVIVAITTIALLSPRVDHGI